MVNRHKNTKTTKNNNATAYMESSLSCFFLSVIGTSAMGISQWRPFKTLMFVVSVIRFSGHGWRLRAVFCEFDFYMFYGLCHLGSGPGMKLRI